MKHVIQELSYDGQLIEINDKDLIDEWNNWYKKKEANPSDEVYQEGILIYDKFRKRYNITTKVAIGHLKEKPNQLAMTISDLPLNDTVYHDTDSKWAKYNLK